MNRISREVENEIRNVRHTRNLNFRQFTLILDIGRQRPSDASEYSQIGIAESVLARYRSSTGVFRHPRPRMPVGANQARRQCIDQFGMKYHRTASNRT
jgi:hypothetical protein